VKKYLVIVFLFLFIASAHAQEALTLSGYLKNETAIRLENFNGDLQKEKNIVQLAGEYKIKDDEIVFFTKVRYWYDFMYDLRSKYDAGQDSMGHVQRTDWLRDCYLDYTNGPWFLRLGKQQVAWGQSDGITVLDRVNPVDLSEYWLQDFEDMRIPLWMANINYSPKLNSNLQILIIPDFEQSTSAPPNAPFVTYSYYRYENWRKAQKDVNQRIYFPGKQFENSTFGLQWSDRIGDLNYTLNYLNGFYYSARNTTIWVSGSPFGGSTSVWNVDRAFKRYRMYGASFNKTFTNEGIMQGITLRGDAACYNDEPTYYGDPALASTSGIKRWDNKFWIIGVDKYVVTNWLLSVQFGQYILEHAKALGTTAQRKYPMNAFTYGAMDQIDNIFSIKLSTDFLNERLKPEILWSFTDDNQGRVSPKLNYEIKDNLWLTVGIHYFYGNLFDSNGQYRDQSQFYTNLKFSF
jgi:hypothetical protein